MYEWECENQLSVNFRPQLSTRTATWAAAGRLLQVSSLVIGRRTDVTIGALVHLLADGVHQLVKNLLHVDVVFGTGLKELEAWRGQREEEALGVTVG